VYGAEYAHDANVVRLFALYYVCLANSDVIVAALSARRRTRRIFAGHIVGAAVSVAVGWALVRSFGVTGAVGGMLAAIGAAVVVFVSDRVPARTRTTPA
jgi:O-antigen/teichoic acid export membrane protein